MPSTAPTVRSALARVRALRWRADLVCIAFITAVYVWRFVTYTGGRVGGDGFYSWIFARSLGMDGDLDLRNDYAFCGDPWHVGLDEGGHRPANPFYLGPALIWGALLRVIRVIVPLGAHPTPAWQHGCEGPWQVGTLAFTPLFAALTVWLGYRVARRFTAERPALAAMFVVAFGSPLLHFGTLIVSYSHSWAAFGLAVAWITWIRATERPTSVSRWLFAGMGVGLAALMRSQAVVFLAMPAITLAIELWGAVRERRAPWRTLLHGVVVLVGFASLFWIQLVAFHVLYGSWWVIPQGRTYLQLAHGHPWLLLFAARGGLLYWHPLMWLGLIGLGLMLARRSTRTLGLALALPTIIDLYVSASVLDWHGAASFGARRLTTLAAPWVATTAILLAALWAWLRARPRRIAVFAATGWLLPWVVINFGASTGNVDGRIPYDRAVPMPQLYGDGFRLGLAGIYEAVGNPFVLPASLVFSARYGLHPRKFDAAATGGLFVHHYRPLSVENADAFAFADPSTDDQVIEGLARVGGGRVLHAGERGRMLVELGWPFITDVALTARAPRGRIVHLHVVNGSFTRRHPVADVLVTDRGREVEFPVPPNAFDSGINELVFTADGDVTLERWRWIDRAPHDTSVH